ncbi:MAG: hypothetical protein JWO89_1739 [Verrucomicrobiaceae bacterium]|nr:hypothetical protein [Verrucomicrobiaceae bacterium]
MENNKGLLGSLRAYLMAITILQQRGYAFPVCSVGITAPPI